eukprot:2888963-Rhodomonas_salina.2
MRQNHGLQDLDMDTDGTGSIEIDRHSDRHCNRHHDRHSVRLMESALHGESIRSNASDAVRLPWNARAA